MSRVPNTRDAEMPRLWGRAYTLAEVLIVMSIFAILLGLGVPAFNSAIKNSDEVSAENQLRIGLAIARDAAVQSSGEEDTAAVFFFTPGGRTSIVPYVRVGTLKQPRSFSQDDLVAASEGRRLEDREVFAPISGLKTVQLPRGWMVRGYAPPGTLDKGSQGFRNGWYTAEVLGRVYYRPEQRGNWVFPETGFYPSVQADPGITIEQKAQSGRLRSTFMVRFRAGTGAIAVADQKLAIVIDPSPDTEFREALGPFNVQRGGVFVNRIDRAEDVADFVRHRLRGDVDGQSGLARGDENARRRMFGVDTDSSGSASSDSVLCRPIAQLAIYREADLAQYVGARGVNRVTGCLYGDPPIAGQAQDIPGEPKIDTSLFATNPTLADLSEKINAWIEGRRPDRDTSMADGPETTSKIFTFGTYLGQTIEYEDADGGGEN